MEKRHNDVAGLDCASALRPLTLGTGADLAQSAYTRVMQEVRARKNTEAVLKSKKKKPLQTKSSTSEVLRHDLKLWKWESNTVSQTQIHPLLSTKAVKKCIFSCDRGGKLRWSKGEKKCFFCFWKIQNCTKITITKFVGKNTRPSSNTSPPTIHWQHFSGVETWIFFFF